ncbi:MAG: PEP-CTERM sorting domain-containing protein [Terriglobia bacterium]
MNFQSDLRKIVCVLACICGVSAAFLLPSSLRAGTITIPDSALSNSLGVYTANGYFTNSLGSVVVMTGGGNANGAGLASGRNDDGFSGPISLPFTLNFFGTNYNQFWANNNGNISFNNGISSYTPEGPTGANEPIISPFFADVDTRNSASGVMYLNSSNPNQLIVTWDGVGYYNSSADKLDSFQLVLNNPSHVPTGEGVIGFFYGTMQWEVGDASGGTDGLCADNSFQDGACTPAAAGFGDGQGNGQILQGSINPGIAGLVNDKYLWFDVNSQGQPVPVPPSSSTPEPASIALFGTGLLGLAWLVRRKLTLDGCQG